MTTSPTTFWSMRLERHLDGMELLSLAAEVSNAVADRSAPETRLAQQLNIDGLDAMRERGPAAATRQELREDFRLMGLALTPPLRRVELARAASPTTPPSLVVEAPLPSPIVAAPLVEPAIEVPTPAPAIEAIPPATQPARAPSHRQARLLSAADTDDEHATFATLDAMGLKPRAPTRRRDAALIKAVQRSIENGHCATTKAMWDRCNWAEWKVAAQARIGVASGPMRECLFDLSVSDWSFTLKLFPSKQERDQHTQAILSR